MSDEVWDTSNEIPIEGMKMAKEVGASVILHTESSFSPIPSVMRQNLYLGKIFIP
ncbi:MAG: hypothetical protein J7J42_03685 [Thermoplasmata archaeon]|nr:hypothetical protein [Thermoplasmata archaeon]